jgi:hypothetical protein
LFHKPKKILEKIKISSAEARIRAAETLRRRGKNKMGNKVHFGQALIFLSASLPLSHGNRASLLMKFKKSEFRKCAFSLLEIMLSLVILVSIGSLLATKGYAFLQERQFYASMQKLSDEIYLTKVLAATYQIDIDLTLTKEGNTLLFTRTTDHIPQKKLSYLFNKKEKYKNLSLKEKKANEIHFYGNGFIELDAPLSFSAFSNPHLERCIDLSKNRALVIF